VIQLIPTKTRRHAHGQPVTIPIHPQLKAELEIALVRNHERRACAAAAFVNPTLADWYKNSKWRISRGLELIFKAAHIETSVRIEGRRTRTPEATFHSLRHTFVSLAANAGVPLPVVQSIVGHSSTAMTRHYYHENEERLRQAVAAIPAIGNGEYGGRGGEWGTGNGKWKAGNGEVGNGEGKERRQAGIPARLRRLDKYLAQGLITHDEHAVQRTRILSEL
jgi:hypothetical protein